MSGNSKILRHPFNDCGTHCAERNATTRELIINPSTSDGLACFNAVTDIGCEHEVHIVGNGPESVEHPAFHWVNTMLGNVKNAMRGTYHAIQAKHLPRYLAEFHYRFNRRYDLPSIIPRFLYIAVRTPPMPQRLLTMAESRW